MAKASASPSQANITATPVTEISGGAAGGKEILAGRTEAWSDTEAPVVVEMDGGLGEQSKATEIMMALRGDGTVEEFGTVAGKVEKAVEATAAKVEAKTEPEAPVKPTRKDLLANIGAEKKARALEKQVAELQAKNKQLTDGSIADAMLARGLTREQAMEKLVLEAVTPAVVDPDPERTALKAKVEELSRLAARAEAAEVQKVIAENLVDVEVPMVKASKVVFLPQDDGTVLRRPTHDVVAELCEQLWIEDGKPPASEKSRRSYIPDAARLLEKAINEDPDLAPLFAAKGGKAEKPAPAKAAVPAVGKRGGPPRPQQSSSDPYAGMDDYTRRLAIARDFDV